MCRRIKKFYWQATSKRNANSIRRCWRENIYLSSSSPENEKVSIGEPLDSRAHTNPLRPTLAPDLWNLKHPLAFIGADLDLLLAVLLFGDRSICGNIDLLLRSRRALAFSRLLEHALKLHRTHASDGKAR